MAQRWRRAENYGQGEIFTDEHGSFCVFVGSFETIFDDIDEARFFIDVSGAGYSFDSPVEVAVYSSNGGVTRGQMSGVRRNFRQIVAVADFGTGLHEYGSAAVFLPEDEAAAEVFARLDEVEADLRRLVALRETLVAAIPRIDIRQLVETDRAAAVEQPDPELPGI